MSLDAMLARRKGSNRLPCHGTLRLAAEIDAVLVGGLRAASGYWLDRATRVVADAVEYETIAACRRVVVVDAAVIAEAIRETWNTRECVTLGAWRCCEVAR